MRCRPQGERSGATVLESAIVMGVFLMLVLGFLDMGLAAFQYHLVSQAARHGARQAIVHGSMAPSTMGTWGPGTIDATADTSGIPLVDTVSPYLVSVNRSQTRIHAEWLDGGTDVGQRVQVTVTVPYQPMVPFVSGTRSISLRGASTLTISH